MRSVRLDPDLDDKVRRAAALEGESVSEFLRQAAAQRADETLAGRPGGRFADVVGAVHGGGRRARRTGDAFVESLAEDDEKR
jgi:Ribbon-helix-helix protein, copG family